MEDERRHRSRDAEDELVTTLRAIVHDEVKTRTAAWPKKNGDGLIGYIGRLITPERIMLAAVLIYQVGGRVQQFTTDIRGLEHDNTQLASRVEDVSGQLYRLAEQQQGAKGTLEKQDAAIADLQKRSRVADERLRLTVTRQEFREAIDQRLVPRLERIEAQGR